MLILLGIIIGLIVFIAYWAFMLMLFLLGVVFYFWVLVIAYLTGDPYVGWVGAIFATGLSFWVWDFVSTREANKS
jgi:hypothetical protein